MTDYKEEQSGEIEALESIYPDELEILSTNPYTFTIPVRTEDFEDGSSEGLYVLLKFTYTPKYPDEVPELVIEEEENMEGDVKEEFESFLKEQMEENLGMVMAFTIVSASIEWLGNKWEQLKNDQEERIRMAKEKEEEELRKKLEGTKVTIESFLAWKEKFDAERLSKTKNKKEKTEGKLTGKEQFLTNASLKDSDIQFLEAAGETVKVDESLFEDLDDLDLDDDDDPDWNPGDSD